MIYETPGISSGVFPLLIKDLGKSAFHMTAHVTPYTALSVQFLPITEEIVMNLGIMYL